MRRFELFFAFLLIPFDILAIVVAFVLSYYFRSHLVLATDFFNIGLQEYLRYCLYIIPVWIGLFALNGLYDLATIKRSSSRFSKILISSSTAMLFFIVLIFLTKSFFFSRFILVLTWTFSILTIYIARVVHDLFRKILLRRGHGRERLMLVGNNKALKDILEYIKTKEKNEYDFIGMVSDNKDLEKDIKDLGDIKDLEKIILKERPDELILTDTEISRNKMLSVMQSCYDMHVRLRYVPDAFSLVSANFKPVLIGSMPVMELKSIPLDGWGRITKRFLDIVFAIVGLIIASPIMLIISFLQKITSPGPILYLHQRIGRDGSVFDFYKFRSMYHDKCDYEGGVAWTTQSDDKVRVTPLGRVLRKTNLDELPQLFNILKGEMSFVGPRPELPKHVKKFEQEIPDYFRRHKVKVGLTGWAQVNGLKGDTSIAERVKYDIYYIENWSLWLDAKIILKTIFLVGYETLFGKFEYRSRS